MSDLSPLAGLKNLEALRAHKQKSVTYLLWQVLENLQRLHRRKTEVSDLSPLAEHEEPRRTLSHQNRGE